MPGGGREGVVVVVPGLPHGRQGEQRHVVAHRPRALQPPALRPAGVGDPRDEPVHRGTGAGFHADAPDDERPAAEGIERRRER